MRRRPPAYARALADRIDRGDVPDWVGVYYGTDWDAVPRESFVVCVGADYQPGAIDWRVLCGLRVHVQLTYMEFSLELVAEIANVAAPVIIQKELGPWLPNQRHADDFLFTVRDCPILAALWSPQQRADYERRERDFDIAVLMDTFNGSP